MKVLKTIDNNNKVQSFYLICRNSENKYQAVAFPWGRIDYRIFNTEEDVFNTISEIVKNRGWKTEWTNICYEEKYGNIELTN